ncbi:hypothetical protein DFJ77DRAFT_445974 [Powellomyces hirtus]|nr:hypothetical protein DFJ77DRAFT_445974 [Powellomyces hirtus]
MSVQKAKSQIGTRCTRIDHGGASYVVCSRFRGEVWHLDVIGDTACYTAHMNALETMNLFPANSPFSNFEASWLKNEITFESPSPGSSPQLTVGGKMNEHPTRLQMTTIPASESFQFMREIFIDLAEARQALPSTEVDVLRATISDLRIELDALRRTSAQGASLHMEGGLPKRSAPVKRAAPAKSLVNPRLKNKVARGTVFGDDSDSED